jgi:hypothetical protein
MKLLTAGMISVLAICAANAAAPRAESAVPQPRPRLDPTRQTAVPTPVAEEKPDSNPALVLDRLVVKEQSVLRERPPAVEDPKGEFSPTGGGRFLRRDAGPIRVEAGVWPAIDLFAEESRFKPTKVLVELDLVRIKF